MKLRNLFLGLVLCFSTVAMAQEKGEFEAYGGAAAALGTGSSFGINAGVEYVFADNFSAAPSFTYYFSDPSQTQVNLDVRYYLGDDSFNWFATAGVSFNSISVPTGAVIVSGSANATGLNIGAGSKFSLGDSLELLSVVTYNTAISGVVPMVGLNFSL